MNPVTTVLAAIGTFVVARFIVRVLIVINMFLAGYRVVDGKVIHKRTGKEYGK